MRNRQNGQVIDELVVDTRHDQSVPFGRWDAAEAAPGRELESLAVDVFEEVTQQLCGVIRMRDVRRMAGLEALDPDVLEMLRKLVLPPVLEHAVELHSYEQRRRWADILPSPSAPLGFGMDPRFQRCW